MLEICNLEHFDKVIAFARTLPRKSQKSLVGCLRRLHHFGGIGLPPPKAREYSICKLGKDHAPHSFSFSIYRGEDLWFVGGLIYDGPESPNDGSFPALTVSLSRECYPTWSINT